MQKLCKFSASWVATFRPHAWSVNRPVDGLRVPDEMLHRAQPPDRLGLGLPSGATPTRNPRSARCTVGDHTLRSVPREAFRMPPIRRGDGLVHQHCCIALCAREALLEPAIAVALGIDGVVSRTRSISACGASGIRTAACPTWRTSPGPETGPVPRRWACSTARSPRLPRPYNESVATPVGRPLVRFVS
jgi:hypothetical protein